MDLGKETVASSPLDAEPDTILKMPEESLAPVLLSLFLTFIFAGLALHIWTLAVIGIVASGLDILYWLWPRHQRGQTKEVSHVA